MIHASFLAPLVLFALLVPAETASGQSLPQIRIEQPRVAPFASGGLYERRLPVFRQRTIAEDAAARRAVRGRLDGSTIDPQIRGAPSRGDDLLRARAGRPDLDRGRAGVYGRAGPGAIGVSPVTRPSLGARRIGPGTARPAQR